MDRQVGPRLSHETSRSRRVLGITLSTSTLRDVLLPISTKGEQP